MESIKYGEIVLRVRLYQGHVLDALKQIPDESIDCIITSPPYWSLRKYPDAANVVWDADPNCEHEWEVIVKPKERGSYGKSSWHRPSRDVEPKWKPQASAFCKRCGAWYGQLGLEPSLELYLKHMLQITKELKRVLKPTGMMFWVHGDCWSGSGKGYGSIDPKWPNARDARNRIPPNRLRLNIPQKCMCLQNYRLAMRMVDEQGWILRNVAIWAKKVWIVKENRTMGNAMPESVKDRFAKSYEPVFIFVKRNRKYYFDLDAVRVPIKSVNDKRLDEHGFVNPVKLYGGKYKGVLAPFPTKFEPKGKYPDWEIVKSDEDSELTLGKVGRFTSWRNYTKHDLAVGRIGNFSYADPLHTKPIHPLGKNPGDVWLINTEPFPEAHFATFPTELVRQCIKCGCPSNGTVLDPFVGSGTTIKVAIELRRNAIGIDIVPEYIRMTMKRCHLPNPFIDFKLIKLSNSE